MKKDIVYGIMDEEDNLRCLCVDDRAWFRFFENHLHKLPIAEAIKAYESIGFKEVKFKLTRIEQGDSEL